jgi:hypothetical protein
MWAGVLPRPPSAQVPEPQTLPFPPPVSPFSPSLPAYHPPPLPIAWQPRLPLQLPPSGLPPEGSREGQRRILAQAEPRSHIDGVHSRLRT